MGLSRKPRQCPRCGHVNAAKERHCDHCNTPLVRSPFRMDKQRVRQVHIFALVQKGLSEDLYKLNLRAVGVESSKELRRRSYFELMQRLRRLPDAPNWKRQPTRGNHHARTGKNGAG